MPFIFSNYSYSISTWKCLLQNSWLKKKIQQNEKMEKLIKKCMLQDYLQPAGGDILSWVLCSWHVLNSGFLISWESFRHLISWNILKMQIKMVFFFFYDKMLYISELFLHTCTCISMTWKHFFLGGLKAVVYILCLKLHTRPLLLVFLLQCMVFTFLFLFFFCTTGYSFERSCRCSQQESSQNSS